jgi:hypothetical protein
MIPSPCSSAVRATGLDLGHAVSSAPPAAIRVTGGDPDHELASAPSAAVCAGTLKKRNKGDRYDDSKFRRETTQIKGINLIDLPKVNSIGKTL